jgi:hypothetical protein
MNDARIKQCAHCKAPIVWLHTQNLSPMPVDAATVKPEDRLYDHKRHVSHFATCTDPGKFRKRRYPPL